MNKYRTHNCNELRKSDLDKKLINYIIKRIDRSYSNIINFIYKIDEMSLKKKNRLILK